MNLKLRVKRAIRFFRLLRELFLEQIPDKLAILLERIFEISLRVSSLLIPLLVALSFTIMLYTVGFEDIYQQHYKAYIAHRSILLGLAILFSARFLIMLPRVARWRSRFFNLFLVVLVFYLRDLTGEIPSLQEGTSLLITKKVTLFSGILLLFVIEVSHILRFIYRRGVNPALLFAGSFATLIIIGGFLLLLPNATTRGIHPIDAFFTSASAVCVTGLTVVDTASSFTITGKVFLLMLIQIGGLGIMTFAGMISFLVTGSVSIQNQLALRDMLSNNRMSNVISFIARVVFVTITFEAIGAFLIYGTLTDQMFKSHGEKIFFSVFHSVSSFCNAGFSTLSSGLYDSAVRFNYGLHWTIAFLIILGGIGFPIVFNIFTFLRIKIANFVKRLLKDPDLENYTNILQATARLSLITYFILIAFGFVAYFIFEYNYTLDQHTTLFGKITTSFFGSVTPRTAGFNTVDIAGLALPTILVYLLLMFIGASPGSTGGGIKTTVAAVAFLNMKSIVFGHDRTEAFRTEISETSIKRAFAIIILSLLVLGMAVLLLSIYDFEKGLLNLAFEVFSAF
ncbi:MAG TPA: potassium transporter TrkG, partial [Chryseosolibacter sp.]|nr:potassium transporter TrkG [Chryseosolibacter sp.]